MPNKDQCMCPFFLLVLCPLKFPCWQYCNLSSLSLLLRWLHVGSPQGAHTPSHKCSPSTLHQGTAFTRATKVDHLLKKYPTRCAHGARTPPSACHFTPFVSLRRLSYSASASGGRGGTGVLQVSTGGTPTECHARSAKFWISTNTRTLVSAPFHKFLVPYQGFFSFLST